MGAVAVWLANPANLALVESLAMGAIEAGEKLYTTLQIKALNELLAAVRADIAQLGVDVSTMDKDIDARDKALESDLDKATAEKFDTSDKPTS